MSILGDIFGYMGAGRAAGAVANSGIAAEHGVLDATAGGQAGINAAVGNATGNVTNAGNTAIEGVNAATSTANSSLNDILTGEKANLAPYLATGATGATGLQDYINSKPQFSFDPSNIESSPGYQFQLAQGQKAIGNQTAAQGLGQSGAALKELTQYGQGLAGTYYQNYFNQAQQQFQTNQNATLANLTAAINTGQVGTQQFQQANLNQGNPQAQNTINAGLYAGQTGTSVAEYLGSLGLQGAGASGQLGLQGATTAGNFAVGAGQARAGGILGQGNAIAGLGGDLASVIAGIPGVGGTAGGILKGLV